MDDAYVEAVAADIVEDEEAEEE